MSIWHGGRGGGQEEAGEEKRLKGREYWQFTNCNAYLSGRWFSDSCACVFPCVGGSVCMNSYCLPGDYVYGIY